MPIGFHGEAGRSAKKRKPAPRSRSKAAAKDRKPEPRKDFEQAINELRSGVSRLDRLIHRLSTKDHPRPPARAARQPAPPTENEVVKVIERELRTTTNMSTEVIHREATKRYEQLAEQVAKSNAPEDYATVLHAQSKLTPAQALRPESKSVRSLMQAARAIQRGRLPFLPKKTRVAAQKLLNEVFDKKQVAQFAKSAQLPKLVEQHRIIPTIVREMLKKEQQIPRPPAPASRRTPVTASDMPKLAALPAFRGQGGAIGGDYVGHAGEDLHVLTRNDSPLATSDEMAAVDRSQSSVPSVDSVQAPTSEAAAVPTAPRAESGAIPSIGAPGAGAGTVGGGAMPGGQPTESAGPARVEGELRIPELGDALAKFTGFMNSNGAVDGTAIT